MCTICVLGLLMPEMNWGSLLENLTQARLIGEETVDAVVCYKLTATVPSIDEPRTLWIDRDSHLIRRVEWNPAPDSHVTATFKPSLNVAVPPETFIFDPDAEMAHRGD